ncbi:TPA: ImmA/IrrE family metallo-endopeptidase [Klebsiella pneumoniae]|nr:ImmA/IrrE family metallo-endopeptidase [Klebsiella pneumoniae]HBX0709230.1 ImmA/IrrE family metallo-endopeptidase [Klebsiella pneumoniae]
MTVTTHQKPLNAFLHRVSALDPRLAEGLSKLLPDWWDESLNNSASISQQVILGLAKFANLDLTTVINPTAQLRFNDSVRRYKHAANKSVEELQAATAVVDGMAKIAASVAKQPYHGLPSARDIREAILSKGEPWVDFLSLLKFSWSAGIPVLYMTDIPARKKMDAVVIKVSERPVIALTKKHKHASGVLFSLAHELGHIACGHLENNALLIDENINEDDVDNPQEKEANAYAIELLNGRPDAAFHSKGWINARVLAAEALRIGRNNKVDPGHVALNYAKTMGRTHTGNFFPVCGRALNILYPRLDWMEQAAETFLEYVDEDKVSEDKFEMLCRMNNIEV